MKTQPAMNNETIKIQNALTVTLETFSLVGAHIQKAMCRHNANQLTREQFAKAMRIEMPWAFVYVGGCHVAIHNKRDGVRDAVVTSRNPDWN
jgi:hypothetical protein